MDPKREASPPECIRCKRKSYIPATTSSRITASSLSTYSGEDAIDPSLSPPAPKSKVPLRDAATTPPRLSNALLKSIIRRGLQESEAFSSLCRDPHAPQTLPDSPIKTPFRPSQSHAVPNAAPSVSAEDRPGLPSKRRRVPEPPAVLTKSTVLIGISASSDDEERAIHSRHTAQQPHLHANVAQNIYARGSPRTPTGFESEGHAYQHSDLDHEQANAVAVVTARSISRAARGGVYPFELGRSVVPGRNRNEMQIAAEESSRGKMGALWSGTTLAPQPSLTDASGWELFVDSDGDVIMLDETSPVGSPSLPKIRPCAPLNDEARAVDDILQIFPELDPDHIQALVGTQYAETCDKDHTVEVIVQYICESAHVREGWAEKGRVVDRMEGHGLRWTQEQKEKGRAVVEAGGHGPVQAKEEQGEEKVEDEAEGHDFGWSSDEKGKWREVAAMRKRTPVQTREIGEYTDERYASLQLAAQTSKLRCMDSSGCQEVLPIPQLRRPLPRGHFSQLERPEQQDLHEAHTEGLEECPFCNCACIFDMSVGDCSAFECKTEAECGIFSCRLCKKRMHIPLAYDEVEGERLKNRRIAIEEAVSIVVVRKCPQCDKSFVKQEWRNKMDCPIPGCKAMSQWFN